MAPAGRGRGLPEAAGTKAARNLPGGRGSCGRGLGRRCPRRWPALATGVSPGWARFLVASGWRRLCGARGSQGSGSDVAAAPSVSLAQRQAVRQPNVGQGDPARRPAISGGKASSRKRGSHPGLPDPPQTQRHRGRMAGTFGSDRLCWSPWCRRVRGACGRRPSCPAQARPLPAPDFLPRRDSACRGRHRVQGAPPSPPSPPLSLPHPPHWILSFSSTSFFPSLPIRFPAPSRGRIA